MSKDSQSIEAAKKKTSERQDLRKHLRKGDIIKIAKVIGISPQAVQSWLYGDTIESAIIEDNVLQVVELRKAEIAQRRKELFNI